MENEKNKSENPMQKNPLIVIQGRLIRRQAELKEQAVQLEQGYQQIMGKIALIDEILKWNIDEIVIEKKNEEK